MTVAFSQAQKYLSNNAIYAPKIIDDYIAYRGSTLPESAIYIPSAATGNGYNIITKAYSSNSCLLIRNDSEGKLRLNMPQFFTSGYQYNFEQELFLSNILVFNYKTTTLSSFMSSSSTGYAYRLRKTSYQSGSVFYPRLVAEKIGNFSDIYEKYKNYALLTDIQAFVDSGKNERSLYGTINQNEQEFAIWSVSTYSGTIEYDQNNNYVKTYNQPSSAKFLINQSRYLVSTIYGDSSESYNDFVWFDLLSKVGADVVIFDTGSTDKTGQPAKFGKIAVMFPTPKDVKKLGNTVAMPFVVNNEQLAKTGDLKDFPLYVPAGVPENETGGGEGNGDNDSDKVDEAKNPDLSPISAGNNLYAMNQSELEETFNFLWDGHNKDILGITVSEANILDSLCNCFYFPFDILAHDTTHCSDGKVVAAGYASEINSKIIENGYNKRFNFGDIKISEYYGSYLDYAPYTTISIYLPYIGFKQLDVSKVMEKTINVTYGVDFSQGIVTAYISYYYDGNKQVFAEFSGQMGIPLKVTGKNTTAAENAVKDAAFAVGGFALAAISALAAPATGGASLIGTVGAIGAGVNAIGSTINATTIQPDSVSIGNAGAENWLISPQGCYVYIQRPTTATPEDFKETNGWATRYTGLVSEFTGYLECSEVVNTVNTTAEEKSLISNLLKQGVYV